MAWDRLIKHEGVFTLGETNIYLWMRKMKVVGTLLWLVSAWTGTREGREGGLRVKRMGPGLGVRQPGSSSQLCPVELTAASPGSGVFLESQH